MGNLRVPFDTLHAVLAEALRRRGMARARADLCARLFAEASRDGVASHGLNRFPRFLRMIARGVVDLSAEPVCVSASGAIERWDGQRGPGNLNARAAMARAITVARSHGLGCVALGNTNHWMRGGSYGWQAAEAGVIGICWTNTLANVPPWGATDPRIGNNPLVVAVPRPPGHVVLDMALSQFSVGALNAYDAMDAVITLARLHGIGCVALAHTNHWMRGGSYGWQAADAGCVGLCWTNTLPNLPPWGADSPRRRYEASAP